MLSSLVHACKRSFGLGEGIDGVDLVGNEERLLQALSASERGTLDELLRKLLTGLESG
jgi:hypothetical protein